MAIEYEYRDGESGGRSLTQIFSHVLLVLHQRLDTDVRVLVMSGTSTSAFEDGRPFVKVVQQVGVALSKTLLRGIDQ